MITKEEYATSIELLPKDALADARGFISECTMNYVHSKKIGKTHTKDMRCVSYDSLDHKERLAAFCLYDEGVMQLRSMMRRAKMYCSIFIHDYHICVVWDKDKDVVKRIKKVARGWVWC